MKKEEYCYRILKAYSLIVDFDGEPHRINVPSPIDADETLAQWRSRVLGPDATNVVFYQPTQSAPNLAYPHCNSAPVQTTLNECSNR